MRYLKRHLKYLMPFLSICPCRCLIHKWELGLWSESWVLLIHWGHKEGLSFSQRCHHGGYQHNWYQRPCTRVHPRPLLCWYPGGCCSWRNHPHGTNMNKTTFLTSFSYLCCVLFTLPLHLFLPWAQPFQRVCVIWHLRLRHDLKNNDCQNSWQPIGRDDSKLHWCKPLSFLLLI